MTSIFHQTLDLLKNRYAGLIQSLTIKDVRIGVHLTAIQLSDGSSGMSSTIRDNDKPVDTTRRNFGDFTPAQIRGQSVMKLFDADMSVHYTRSLVIAAMNAVSSTLLSSGEYRVLAKQDPLDLVDTSPGRRFVIVGAFQSYIRRLATSGVRLQVLELDEQALQPVHREFYVPAERYADILPGAGVVIITGLTLANQTLDNLLKVVTPETEVILTGPTSSFIPDVLFGNKVKYMGAIRITDPDLALEVAGQGGGGYHLFRYCAEKICILRP